MTNTHARIDDAWASLHLLRCAGSATILLGLLSTGVAAYGQTLTFWNPRDLLSREPAAFFQLLDMARLAPVSAEQIEAILRTLPPEGEITRLEPLAQQKVDAVRQLLAATRRDWYQIKVIDVPQAAIGLHARAVVLISAPAVALLSAAELQAVAGHEIGHEYVWTEYGRARQDADQQRLKDLELVCDAIAVVTLRRLRIEPSNVILAIEKISRFNRQRFGVANNEQNYPTLTERRTFAREIQRWLEDSRSPSPDLERPSVLLRAAEGTAPNGRRQRRVP